LCHPPARGRVGREAAGEGYCGTSVPNALGQSYSPSPAQEGRLSRRESDCLLTPATTRLRSCTISPRARCGLLKIDVIAGSSVIVNWAIFIPMQTSEFGDSGRSSREMVQPSCSPTIFRSCQQAGRGRLVRNKFGFSLPILRSCRTSRQGGGWCLTCPVDPRVKPSLPSL
jgi:hypothetical protein